ncbi:hypothetical protein HOP50_11g64230 [Chloropicon primus]|nr:hypothetical protein HOP50_11g64230 [Chloropicon primus]
MKSERGEKLNKAMRDVMELKAAREAIPEDSPALQAERRRMGKLRAESIEELQDRLAEVEKAKEDLDSVGAQQEDLVALLKESTERIESLKCAVAGAGAGALFSLPLLLLDFDILSLGSAVASSALFALTYRYAVTNDVENTQLKSGVVLAFALTRGLSTLNPGHRETSTIGEVLGVALSGENIVHGIQSLLLFAFVSAALEYGFREDLLCLYGEGEITKKS